MKNIISGMFAISTYHAANLQRHTPDWMTWSEYRINMTWLGFTDIHSGIQRYFVSIGSEYMANDLNKVTIGVSITKRYVYDPKSDCVMLKVAD